MKEGIRTQVCFCLTYFKKIPTDATNDYVQEASGPRKKRKRRRWRQAI